MSTVVGIVKNGKVWLGADSYATTSDGERRRIICNKIFVNGPYLMGYIGSVRTGQVLAPREFDPPENVLDFPDFMINQFKEKGCIAVQSDNQVILQEGNTLIATLTGELYEVLADFQINQVKDFTAIGSGSMFAVGSLYTTRKSSNTKKRILTALEVASVYDMSTGPPFVVEEFSENES